jgi:hypothetical protein
MSGEIDGIQAIIKQIWMCIAFTVTSAEYKNAASSGRIPEV